MEFALGHGFCIWDENIATPFRLTMKVFNKDDNIVKPIGSEGCR
jgi:hypothetical protein